MPYVAKINKKLDKAFEGKVEANVENGNLVLTGQLERWNQVVAACMIAASEDPDASIVSEISCTVEKPLPIRKPLVRDSKLDSEEPDVLIIGGGVIGCSVARELSRYGLSILLVEKEHDLAMQATGHSTGLVHSGIKLRKGSMKLWYTKLGNQKLESLCKELNVPYNRSGQYLFYTNPAWTPFLFLSKLYWLWNGLKGTKALKDSELKTFEPGINTNVGGALFFPSGGTVDPHALTIALAENAVSNGAIISLSTMVEEIKVEDGVITSVTTNRGTIRPKAVVNAAGLFCEDIAALAGDKFYSVHPIKGTCVVADRKYADDLAHTVISMHGSTSSRRKRASENIYSVLRTTHGTVLAGPFFIETMNKEDYSTDRFSFEKNISLGKRITPELDPKQVITYFSGVSPATYSGDFIVSVGKSVTNMVHAAGIHFPGLTASPAIAEDIVDMVADMFGGKHTLRVNAEFNPIREAPKVLKGRDLGSLESLIAGDPDYGVIVCHCEMVSKGEIVESLRRDVKCDTINGVKHRTRAGMGRCQGQCCTPAIVEIIAGEKRLAPSHVRKSGAGSELVFGKTHVIAEKPKAAFALSDRKEHKTDMELSEKLRNIEAANLRASKGQKSDGGSK